MKRRAAMSDTCVFGDCVGLTCTRAPLALNCGRWVLWAWREAQPGTLLPLARTCSGVRGQFLCDDYPVSNDNIVLRRARTHTHTHTHTRTQCQKVGQPGGAGMWAYRVAGQGALSRDAVWQEYINSGAEPISRYMGHKATLSEAGKRAQVSQSMNKLQSNLQAI
eukprot:scaffold51485_cov19-Tisochrysis_lutea.AAC.1